MINTLPDDYSLRLQSSGLLILVKTCNLVLELPVSQSKHRSIMRVIEDGNVQIDLNTMRVVEEGNV